MPAERQPAARAVELDAREIDADETRHRHQKNRKRQAAHAERREERHGGHQEHAGNREQNVALDEVVLGEPLLLRHRRTGGEREHDARGDDDQDCRQENVVHREPPLGEPAPVRAADPHGELRPQIDAGQRRDELAEVVAANLEVLVLVVGGARGREQHDRLRAGTLLGVPRRRRERRIERAAALEIHLALERRREFLRRRADQIGLGDAREVGFERRDAALLRLAAEDPEDIPLPRRERLLGRVRIRRFAVVDEEHAAEPADLLHAVRQTRKARERGLQCLGLPHSRRSSGSRIQPVLQRTDGRQRRERILRRCAARAASARPRATRSRRHCRRRARAQKASGRSQIHVPRRPPPRPS